MRRLEDEGLARLLAELRREDEASAPSLREVLARAREIGSSAPSGPALWIAAAALIVALAAGALLLRRSDSDAALQSAARLARWKSPTDFLMRTPGAELLSSGPDLTSPLLESSLPEISRDRRTPSPPP
jgi:hypothetical protein